MRTMKIAIVAAAGIWCLSSQAHEGRDHDAPTTLKAPKGGIVKALDESKVEVVARGKDLKIYFYDNGMAPAKASDFRLVAKAEMPRSKKEVPIELIAKDTYFEGSFDAKGSHRYTLKLAVTESKTGRTENLNFTIEPRK